MAGKILSVIVALTLACSAQPSFAQNNADGKSTASAGPRRQIGTIVFAGLAGAVLGLSTLSFYGRPQDKLANIPVGFAVGAIVGTMFTTYKAVAEPREFYGSENKYDFRPADAPMASYVFEF